MDCVSESLALGLSVDEAIGRARLHALEFGLRSQLFDWGLYTVYMPSPQAVLFPRAPSRALADRQTSVREQHKAVGESTLQRVWQLDGMNFGAMMSEATQHRVLILGRFTDRRLKVLEAIKQHLERHPNGYKPEVFTYARPESRDPIEAITAFAGFSRFIVLI